MIRFHVITRAGSELDTFDTLEEANAAVDGYAALGCAAYVDAHEPEVAVTTRHVTLLDRAVESRRRRERMRSIGVRSW